MKFTVASLVGESWTCEAEPTSTVWELREQVAMHQETAPHLVTLVVNGSKLTNDMQTLQQAGIKEGSKVMIVLALSEDGPTKCCC